MEKVRKDWKKFIWGSLFFAVFLTAVEIESRQPGWRVTIEWTLVYFMKLFIGFFVWLLVSTIMTEKFKRKKIISKNE